MPQPTTYREYPPHRDLARHVACYWTLRQTLPPCAGRTDAVLPDGCLDFLFDLGAARAHLVGTMTRPLAVPRRGAMDLVGVRFRPGAAPAFLDLPAHAVTDDVVPLADVLGAPADGLLERLAATPDAPGRVVLLDRSLRARRARRAAGDEAMLAAAALLERSRGGARVDDVAAAVGLRRRQFERRFLAAVGVPAGTARRVVRFQSVVARMHGGAVPSLSRLALDVGYHDQAHMGRDFKALSGETPAGYLRRRGLGTTRSA